MGQGAEVKIPSARGVPFAFLCRVSIGKKTLQVMSNLASKLYLLRFFWLSVVVVALTGLANSGPVQWSDNGLFLTMAAEQPWFATDLSEMSHPLFHLVAVAMYHFGGTSGLAWLNVLLLPLVGGLAFSIARRLDADDETASAAMAAALSAHCLLWVGTKVEVYILNLALILACWAVYLSSGKGPLSPFRLFVGGTLAGLALSVHQLTVIVLAPMAVMLLWQCRWRVIWAAPGFLLGLAACWPAFVEIHGRGMPLFDIVRGFLTGGGHRQVNDWEQMFLRLDHLRTKLHLVATVLVSLFGCGVMGLVFRPRGAGAWLLWIGASMNLVFAATYDVPDRFTFFLPGAVLFGILGAVAMGRRHEGWFSRQWLMPLILLPMLACHLVPLVASEALMKMPRVKSPAPFLNPLTYYFSPLVPDRSAERFARVFEQVVPPGGVVYADFLSLAALRSAQKVGIFVGREVRPCPDFKAGLPSAKPSFLVQPLECAGLMPYAKPVAPLGYVLAWPGAQTP